VVWPAAVPLIVGATVPAVAMTVVMPLAVALAPTVFDVRDGEGGGDGPAWRDLMAVGVNTSPSSAAVTAVTVLVSV